MMTTLTISLPESLKDFVDDQVKTKGYGNVSEYFRGLLRDAQAREADNRLEALLLEGLESGKGIEVTPEWWSQRRAGILRRVAERKRSKIKR